MEAGLTPEEVVAFFSALGDGRFDEMKERLAEDVVLEFPGSRYGARVEGRRKVIVFLRQNQRLFDGGLAFRVHWAGVDGNRAVAQWTNAGTTRDGKAYENRGCTVFRVAGGRIVEIQDYLDTERIAETWPA
ncbi:MAG: nuclear transport factor 2 family protein [Planctomycetota bacterium]|jgi:ketosteroid isomerase-like protein